MHFSVRNVYALWGLGLISACASIGESDTWSTPRTLGAEIPAFRAPLYGDAVTKPDAAPQPEAELSLDQAIALSLRYNPELRGLAYEVRSKQALAQHAGLWPNPELAVDVEDIVVSRGAPGLQSTQLSATLSQELIIGGETDAKAATARYELEDSAWAYEEARLELLTKVRNAFIEVLAAQHRSENAGEMAGLAREVAKAFALKTEAGRSSGLETQRAQVALVLAEIEHKDSLQLLDLARADLASLWGGSTVSFKRAVGTYGVAEQLPQFAQLQDLLTDSPRLQRAQVQLKRSQAQLAYAHGVSIPNPAMAAGYRWINDVGDSALLFGISVPVPLIDRNQGQIQATEYALQHARENVDATKAELTLQLERDVLVFTALHDQAQALTTDVLPLAREAYGAVVEGYRLGRYGYLEIIDAQRTLFEVQRRSIEAQSASHQALARLEGLVGRAIINTQQSINARQSDDQDAKTTPTPSSTSAPEVNNVVQ